MRTLHIAESFYDFVADVRPEEVKQVQKCLRLLKEDPANPGLRRHKLTRIKSKNVVSYSPNQDIRIIAYEPTNDASYLLYVGHHDDAYNWAANRRIDHDDLSKVIRIARVEAAAVEREPSATPDDSSVRPLAELAALLPERTRGQAYFFDALTDDELLASDVPPSYLALARRIQSEADLMFLLDRLPQSVGEALFALAGRGATPSEAGATPVNTTKEQAEASAGDDVIRYRSFTSDASLQEWIDDLEAALQKPFEDWLRFLHPAQRKAVQARSSGPLRVTGAAGTGKTVVGMHRAKHLGESEFKRVHFLTYNRALMNNLLGLSKSIFAGELGRKYHVNTLHGFLAQRLEAVCGHSVTPVDMRTFLEPGLALVMPQALAGAWDQGAVNTIANDILHVIAAQRLRSMESYARAPRKGLSRPLSLRQKEELWRVYDAAWTTAKTKMRIPHELWSHYALEQNLPPLAQEALIVDEVQDLQGVDLAFLAQQAPGPNQLTLLEDAKQRIYGLGYSLRALGINVAGRRSVKLFVNYRTTAEIGRVASRSLSDLGLPESEWPRPLRNGRSAEVMRFASSAEEHEWLVGKIHDCQGRGLRRIAVLARRRRTLEDLEQALDAEGIEYAKLDRNQSIVDPGVVSLCTMHSSKGLEFEAVFVVGVDHDGNGMPLPKDLRDDAALARDFEKREKHLTYVAMSRARDELYISGTGAVLAQWQT